MRRLTVPLTAAPLLLCLACSSDRPAPAPPYRAEGTEPCQEEQSVEAFLAEKAKGYGEVTVTRWGPHDLEAKEAMRPNYEHPPDGGVQWMGLDNRAWAEQLASLGDEPLPIVRARYRVKNKRGEEHAH